MSFKILLVSAILALLAGVVGCEQDGPAERAGEKVDESVEKAGEKIEEAGDAIRDKTN